MEVISLKQLGYPGYAVREDGVVINTVRVSVLKPYICKGYHRVLLYKPDGSAKKEFVHRLVALSFIENPEGKPCVNHIDSNPGNNSLKNLEWCTHQENTQHCIAQGRYKKRVSGVMTDEFMSLICNLSLPVKQVAELTGLSKGLICYHRRKFKE